MSDEILIRAENVGKKFCRNLKKSLMYGAQDIGYDLMGVDRSHAGLRKDEFWANEGVSFELRRGECLGLIGKNGAGKTTLLKMLNGLIRPDTGTIEMRGRVGALIALGTGFNPILTGKENVYIAGSVLGLSKREIRDRYEEIVDFAELHEFMDTPVQSYSSGMQVRLGFAIATAMKPDILLLDEVLAVGDAAFRNKCYQKVSELLEKAAVILVTHNMAHIGRIATKVLVMKGGKPTFYGAPSEGIAIYNDLNEQPSELKAEKPMLSGCVTDARISFDNLSLDYGECLKIEIQAESQEVVKGCFFYIYIFDLSGTIIAQWVSNADGQLTDLEQGHNEYQFQLGPLHLNGGMYKVSVIMKDETGLRNLIWSDQSHELRTRSSIHTEGPYQIPST
jgi:lipopolysaccharide transport system ATP-binding protein